jgi:hypothetical protein
VVNKTIDGAVTESWLRRARAEGSSDAGTTAASDSAAVALGNRSRDGWDPWEVWLRHIDQPRRHFAARRLKSVD